MAISSVYCAKERFIKRTPYFRPFIPELIHKLPIIQNVDIERGKTTAPSRLLDNSRRFDRRLLAHTNSSKQTSLFGFPLQRASLAVQSNALRPQHSPKGIHKVNFTCSERVSGSRGLDLTLPRRSSGGCADRKRMSSTHTVGTKPIAKARFHSQQQEVKVTATTVLPMAWSGLESSTSHSSGYHGQNTNPSQGSCYDSSLRLVSQKQNSEPSRLSQLCESIRHVLQAPVANNKENFESCQKLSQGCKDNYSFESQDASFQVDNGFCSTTASGCSGTKSDHPDGCDPQRVGNYNRQQTFPRHFRRDNVLFHQCLGTSGYLVCSASGTRRKPSNSYSLRQFDGSRGIKKRRLSIFSSVIPSGTYFGEGNSTKLDVTGILYQRSLQCDYRPVVKERSPVNRMVAFGQKFQNNSSVEPRSSGGPLCYESQQQTSSVCLPLPGQFGDSSGCAINQLGTVGSPVSVSTDSNNLQSVSEIDLHKVCERHSDNPRDADQAMVHETSPAQGPFITFGSQLVSTGGREASNTSQSNETSRVAVIREAYKRKSVNDPRVLHFLTHPLVGSSLRDYERKWLKFCTFLRLHKVSHSDITLGTALNFFTYLFDVQKFKPGTISHYRSALAVPLREGYNIDLGDPAVKTLLRAMYLERPNQPAASPSWSLNKVLLYLDGLPELLPMDALLQKTAFLLLLATGFRISELQACVRQASYCYFNGESNLFLRPDPTFLAKNECRKKRWSHSVIKPLILQDGSHSNLCPVRTLQVYLEKTSRVDKGAIFLHLSTWKPLTVQQLSKTVCNLILTAEPGVKASVHDIRKYASSMALAETMDITEVMRAVKWKSPHTFWKFYMAPTEPLTIQAVLPTSTSSTLE